MPRKTTYTQALADEICHLVSEGRPLKTFCREKGLPWRTVYDWVRDHPDFAERYQLARDMGMDAIAEEALEIADTPQVGTIVTEKGTSTETRTEDMLGHRKLRFDARLKLLAKWNPKKYGERVVQEVSFSRAPRDMSTEELQAAIAREKDADA